MKRILILTIIGVAMGLQAAANSADSIFVVKALQEARTLKGGTCLTLHFARLLMAKPYVAHTLEVNNNEQLVVNTRQLDCTTLVENVVALTLCTQRQRYSFSDFKKALTEIRYRRGVMNGYTSRLHYFSDWIDDNARRGLVAEVQQPVPPFTAVQTLNINYMSSHPQQYKALKAHPEWVAIIKRQEEALTGRKYRYIPKADVKDTKAMRQAIHDGDIIAITCRKAGLDIAHLGFAVWRNDGLHLLNASQLHKQVVEEPMTLGQYLKKHPTHTGIRVIRMRE